MEIGNGVERGMTGEELYRRFCGGDEAAFVELVALYDTELFSFINSIVNDFHEAKHLSIEAFSELALNANAFKEKSSIKTYLFAIGKNLAKRYVKIREREQHISYEEAIEILITDGETPQSHFEREENRLLLHRVMGELKEEYRIVLELLYFEDLSYFEAGMAMRKNVKQVANLAFRAKISLKKKLESAGFIE